MPLKRMCWVLCPVTISWTDLINSVLKIAYILTDILSGCSANY